jgi:hypothetical protein
MKNALGTQENLKLYNKNGVMVYEFAKNSKGYWFKKTYAEKGNQLTYENSDGRRIGFDIPEYTMEGLVEKLGNFKIKK